MSKPKVTIFSTISTMSSSVPDALEINAYYGYGSKSTALTGEQVVESIPELAKIVAVDRVVEDFMWQYSINNYLALARMISKVDTPVVIMRGTNDLSELAFFLDVVLPAGSPQVVVTGSMRPFSALSSDAKYNLVQACSLAVSEEAKGRGVLISLGDRITSGHYGMKTSANRMDTFQSYESGQLGIFANWVPIFFYEPAKPLNKPNFADLMRDESITTFPKVGLVWSNPDQAEDEIARAIAPDVEGLVFAFWATGGVSHEKWSEELNQYAAKGLPVVAASNIASAYMVPHYLVKRNGHIAAGHLSPSKSKMLLALSLAAYGKDVDKISKAFGTNWTLPRGCDL